MRPSAAHVSLLRPQRRRAVRGPVPSLGGVDRSEQTLRGGRREEALEIVPSHGVGRPRRRVTRVPLHVPLDPLAGARGHHHALDRGRDRAEDARGGELIAAADRLDDGVRRRELFLGALAHRSLREKRRSAHVHRTGRGLRADRRGPSLGFADGFALRRGGRGGDGSLGSGLFVVFVVVGALRLGSLVLFVLLLLLLGVVLVGVVERILHRLVVLVGLFFLVPFLNFHLLNLLLGLLLGLLLFVLVGLLV